MWPLTVFMLITSCLVSDHTHWIPEITRERLVSGQRDGADRWKNPVVGFQSPREFEILPYFGMIGAIGMLTITTCHNLFSANHQMPWLWFGMLKHVETQERNQAQWRCVAAIASQLCCVAGVGPWHDSVPRLATHRACQCHATAAHQGCQAHQTAWCRQAKLVTQLSCFMVQNVQTCRCKMMSEVQVVQVLIFGEATKLSQCFPLSMPPGATRPQQSDGLVRCSTRRRHWIWENPHADDFPRKLHLVRRFPSHVWFPKGIWIYKVPAYSGTSYLFSMISKWRAWKEFPFWGAAWLWLGDLMTLS